MDKEITNNTCCADVNKDAQIYSLQEQVQLMNKDLSDYRDKINFLKDLFAEAQWEMRNAIRSDEMCHQRIYKYNQLINELHNYILSMPNNKYRKELLNIFNKFNI